ncbi:hypothetical protein D3C73_1202790 [compost metagenome]
MHLAGITPEIRHAGLNLNSGRRLNNLYTLPGEQRCQSQIIRQMMENRRESPYLRQRIPINDITHPVQRQRPGKG